MCFHCTFEIFVNVFKRDIIRRSDHFSVAVFHLLVGKRINVITHIKIHVCISVNFTAVIHSLAVV